MACTSGKCSKNKCLGGCGFLNAYDWFDNMLPPNLPESSNIYEVRFKKTRKGFFANVYSLNIKPGDWVVVENKGRDDKIHHDIGQVTLGGVAAIMQLNKKYRNSKTGIPTEFLRIIRKATEEDMERLKKLREKEQAIFFRTREIIKKMCPEMKLSEVEYVGDGRKMYFYYIADGRVDFRELLKVLGREFKVRVEMNQINKRSEAALVGGYGSCGRPLCCSTFLYKPKTVEIDSARFQNAVINSAKLTGLCGKLKCCFNYELDIYLEIYKQIPDIREIETEKGKYVRKKIEVLKKKIWYSLEGEKYKSVALTIEQLKTLQEKINKGEKIYSLEEEFKDSQQIFDSSIEELDNIEELNEEVSFVDGVGENLKEALLTTKPQHKIKKKRKRKSKKVHSRTSKRHYNRRR